MKNQGLLRFLCGVPRPPVAIPPHKVSLGRHTPPSRGANFKWKTDNREPLNEVAKTG